MKNQLCYLTVLLLIPWFAPCQDSLSVLLEKPSLWQSAEDYEILRITKEGSYSIQKGDQVLDSGTIKENDKEKIIFLSDDPEVEGGHIIELVFGNSNELHLLEDGGEVMKWGRKIELTTENIIGTQWQMGKLFLTFNEQDHCIIINQEVSAGGTYTLNGKNLVLEFSAEELRQLGLTDPLKYTVRKFNFLAMDLMEGEVMHSLRRQIPSESKN